MAISPPTLAKALLSPEASPVVDATNAHDHSIPTLAKAMTARQAGDDRLSCLLPRKKQLDAHSGQHGLCRNRFAHTSIRDHPSTACLNDAYSADVEYNLATDVFVLQEVLRLAGIFQSKAAAD